ncbi:TonB-dependent receptor [Chitinophaga skermanii]|uniref:TonB-dependent receptor n=1 Tax=Chitinophaga skermanii TaxID=331697 RepID=A0A327R6C6_9BACT|nr:TonB-dependent receptor [Chitinophaga skermanii]RAJ11133.1 TonB-dependent receptor [Chitinophaga skermanii]
MFNKQFLIFVGILFFQVQLYAAIIKGKVTNKNGEPLMGALVVIEGKQWHDIAGLDGGFVIKNVPVGEYSLRTKLLSYQSNVTKVVINNEETVIINIVLEDDQKNLQEFVVKGKQNPSSEQTARSLERNADQVLNIVSAKAIQISPDLTVANVLQRISGVSIERNSNGDGQFAILRGMDKRYNYTLVNGVKIPSPDNKYRYVPLDIFPSELLDRLEVYKALTPSMEGDAVGGVVNMVMKDAPATRSLQANLATGYNGLFLNRDFMGVKAGKVNMQSPYEMYGNKYSASAKDFSTVTADYDTRKPLPNVVAGLSMGDRFFKDKFGVIVAGSFQNTYRGSNSVFYNHEVVDTLRGITLTDRSVRQYSEQQTRLGLHAKLDYKLNDQHTFKWYNAYMQFNNAQVRDVQTTQLTIGGYDPEKGNATLSYSTRTRITKQSIYNSTLQGEHRLSDRIEVNWSAVYANATNDQPDNTNIPLHGQRTNFVDKRTTVQNASRRWEHNTDKDLAGYLNFIYKQHIANLPVTWQVGGLYRDKQRENFYNNYQLLPANLQAQYGVDFNSYKDIQWTVQNPFGSVANGNTYSASEKITAGYIQFKVASKVLEAVGGVRVENTNQGYSMKFPIGEDNPNGSQQYTDVLPSLHLRYMGINNTNIRASYFRSLNRPGFAEIIPTPLVNEEYKERGDPNLQHAIADNIDFRYEYFPRPTEQFMAGVFYKRIQNPIEYTLQPDKNRGQDIYLMPGNFGTATNYGVELDFIKYLRNFGVKANYTYTHSSITTSKSKRVRTAQDNGDLKTILVDQTRPLYGQSAHVANVSLLYKNAKRGWDAQLAGSYTGDRINTVSQFVDNDIWQKGFVQLDASVEKTIGKFTVFAKANNLLNTPAELYVKKPMNNKDFIEGQTAGSNKTLIKRDYYERTYLLGFRYKL